MLRVEIEDRMKNHKIKSIVLVFDENDKLGVYCTLTSGHLMDYTNHRVDRKREVWGYIEWTDGMSRRVKF